MAPEQIRPMLASHGPVPTGPGWAFEFEWDGARSLVSVDADRVRVLSGGGRDVTASYPELAALTGSVGHRRPLLDGKVVALDAYGRPDLARLRRRLHVRHPDAGLRDRVPVVCYAFDLLRLDGRPTLRLPYHRRRELLEGLGLDGATAVLPPSFPDADGHAVLDTAAQYDLDGVVAKRADSVYLPGRRSRGWVRTGLRRTQEVLVGGWVPGTGGRAGGVGSLLVGVPTRDGLSYVGSIGTGFTAAAHRELAARLAALESPEGPFAGDAGDAAPPTDRDLRWVRPVLAGEVEYRSWTEQGRLRYPSWLGLLPDRHPAAIRAPVLVSGAAPVPPPPAAEPVPATVTSAEVAALRAQVAPHFVYNALNTISSFVRTDPDQARELLVEFADFTRYSFAAGGGLTTLADEVDNVQRYLALQQARFGPRLGVDVRIDPAVLDLRLPFLTLQQLVACAVEHGVEPRPGGGTVTVRAAESDAGCLITVTDDGSGGEPEPGSPASAMLDAVDQRVRAEFRAGHGLRVDRSPGAGSTVTLRIPRG